MSEEEFRRMCQAHDLTYDYSDDGSVWRRGMAGRDAIRAAARTMDPAVVARIWNEVVDSKLLPDYRAAFYWGG